ncbi:MAG: hypothetical protein M3162_02200 [Thermoproteota archaeon]|nr:hypothetical protein [Thermoproteota archaeon]
MKFFKKVIDKVDGNQGKPDYTEAIFSLTYASAFLNEKLATQFTGKAALCVKSANGTFFEETVKECKDFLSVSKEEFKIEFELSKDKFGYDWIIIIGKETETGQKNILNIAGIISTIIEIIEDKGFSNRILAAIFQFSKISLDHNNVNPIIRNNSKSFLTRTFKQGDTVILPTYLIFNYKKNKFYPFLPIDNENRDTSTELQVLAILKDLVPFEEDYSKWFPIKDIPF